ncbi:TPA: hypothetical protein U1582_000749 [Streptococcus suis]|uniref:DUF5986 family protein n=1 Tax=Streptococcus suis TaxID=1307 RepID=UPI000424FF8A|nr:DUF5986 family protein [Streptococcus suis]NQO00003.1 hypothetical protein [Streptococcus suis]NQO03759.1 hypothetical protein [Streptococcus suis]NQO29893.1 hypothetical protein [Streptococcus suis]NQO68700.1 hypothetical protein [Streptococcus suis]NQO76572.1 hypothetical protein [Streptococcus suis]
MDNLPSQIFKFAQVFSASHRGEIEKIYSDNEFKTKNSRHSLNWDFIYRDIGITAQSNSLISPVLHMGALWTARGVIIERILYVFMMQNRFENVTENYEKHHYLTCIARSKNSHLNSEEKTTLSIELFNDLDDDDSSKSQVAQAKKLLGENYDLIDEIRVITFDKNTQEVSVNRVNAFCEFVDAINITEFDFTKLEEDGRENNPEKPLVALKPDIQKKLGAPKHVNLPDESKEESNEL